VLVAGWDHRPEGPGAERRWPGALERQSQEPAPGARLRVSGARPVPAVPVADSREPVKSRGNQRACGRGGGRGLCASGARGQQARGCKSQGSPDQLWLCHAVSPRAGPQPSWLLGSHSALPVCVAGCPCVLWSLHVQVLVTGETGIRQQLLGKSKFSAVCDNVLY